MNVWPRRLLLRHDVCRFNTNVYQHNNYYYQHYLISNPWPLINII